MKVLWPSNPETNGFVVQAGYSLFGGKGLYGFSIPDPPSPVISRQHKVSYKPQYYIKGQNVDNGTIKNMGQFKDESDPCYISLRAVLKEFVTAEQGVV